MVLFKLDKFLQDNLKYAVDEWHGDDRKEPEKVVLVVLEDGRCTQSRLSHHRVPAKREAVAICPHALGTEQRAICTVLDGRAV